MGGYRSGCPGSNASSLLREVSGSLPNLPILGMGHRSAGWTVPSRWPSGSVTIA